MESTIIDKLYQDNEDLSKYLLENQEPSFKSASDANFNKSMVIAAASYFEFRLMWTIEELITKYSDKNELIIEFAKNKAMNRQFHTFFDWNSKNANKFFGLFGNGFQEFMKAEVKSDEKLDESIKAFVEICGKRNELVHENFAGFSDVKTAKETYDLYRRGIEFLIALPAKFRKYVESSVSQ